MSSETDIIGYCRMCGKALAGEQRHGGGGNAVLHRTRPAGAGCGNSATAAFASRLTLYAPPLSCGTVSVYG